MCEKKSKTIVVRGILCERVKVDHECIGCYFENKNCLQDVPLSACVDGDGTEYILIPIEI